ncbi:MAG TPA: hypothetical protein VD788_11795 [Candidatus Polarisedimenticolaceae bacterium]|nr:hypothetical protein [Candidatus Polarisedimenticolaceae bacterium]
MSVYRSIAELPVRIDAVEFEGLVRPAQRGGFGRRTTIVRLRGAGATGVGEDVNYDAGEQKELVDHGLDLPIRGNRRLGRLERLLDELDLFGREPRHPEARAYRRWAVSSAALDLALRQQRRPFHHLVGLVPRPVRFVKSMSLGAAASIEPVSRILRRRPTTRFKLDAGRGWTAATADSLRGTGAVEIVDLKGAYHGTPVDLAADPALYLTIARGLPDVWLEDPAWNRETRAVLEPFLDRVTWDAPIHSAAEIEALAPRPRMVNMKPSRFGSLARLFEAYAWCRANGVGMYGGGQFELGPGRGQIQYLAALFHPEAPNDVAPTAYHDAETATDLPPSPLRPAPAAAGFAWREPQPESR